MYSLKCKFQDCMHDHDCLSKFDNNIYFHLFCRKILVTETLELCIVILLIYIFFDAVNSFLKLMVSKLSTEGCFYQLSFEQIHRIARMSISLVLFFVHCQKQFLNLFNKTVHV